MKNIYYPCLVLFISLTITSCVSSLYPISENESDHIFREELVGHWSGKDMGTQVILSKAGTTKYQVTVIDKKTSEDAGKKVSFYDTSYFSGFLIQLNNRYYFDGTPDTDHPQFRSLGEETRTALLPIHFIFSIQIIGNNRLSVAGMDIDAMKKYIEKNSSRVNHEKLNKDHILLTADAAALQKNILSSETASFVFNEPDTLNRKK
ncbi:MAG: hypothetical protein IPL50_03480 [Chitinophagaceae bacterium]|nr:hypothetical protein [Chitinophagaceae bacterium]